MLSASSSLISTNCPDLTLSTSFRGKGSAAGDSTRLDVGGSMCGALAGDGLVVVFDTATADCWLANVVVGAASWPSVVRGTEVRRCGGGRVPRAAKGIRV